MDDHHDEAHHDNENDSALERPWWATGLAAMGVALVMAGIISVAAAFIAGQQDSDNPEIALERLVESRTAAYLADAADQMD